ncbi:SoxR reducing system RseC family protein [Thiorhodococcus fuscus]|uniref:SoxR reducing system RseC family protein n=1 Tax=Thiorhodococcus fuscus TaxID=527200 RepID=A0ABW4Y8Q2_9GAMM
MIEERATVVEVGDGFAWVETQRRSSCTQCASSASCGTSVLARLFRQTRNRLKIIDPIGLQTGEQVVIGIADATLNRAALIAYMLPLIALIGASAVATHVQLSEGMVALSGIAGLALGLLLARLLTGGATGQARYRPELVRRDGPGSQVSLASLTRGSTLHDHKHFTA